MAEVQIPEVSIKHTVRTERTFLTHALQAILKPFRPMLAISRAKYPPGSLKLHAPSGVKKACNIREYQLEGIWINELSPKTAEAESETPVKQYHRLYFFAGGGWAMPPSELHWKLCAELCKQLPDYRVSLVSYPLAPAMTAPEVMPILHAMFKTLAQEAKDAGESISLMGDSSGAQLAIVLAAEACSNPEIQYPIKNVMSISGSMDLRKTHRPMTEAARCDPIMTWEYELGVAEKWAGTLDRESPELSPLLIDLSGLERTKVNIHGVYGTYDLLAPDNRLFWQKLEKLGIEGEWLEWERQMHVFPIFFPYWFKEAIESVAWMVDVLKRHV